MTKKYLNQYRQAVKEIQRKEKIHAENQPTSIELLLDEKLACEHLRNQILKYIDSVNDVLIRLILKCRYLDLMSWRKVAAFVGGNNTPDGVRKIAERFLKNDKVLERLSKENFANEA